MQQLPNGLKSSIRRISPKINFPVDFSINYRCIDDELYGSNQICSLIISVLPCVFVIKSLFLYFYWFLLSSYHAPQG